MFFSLQLFGNFQFFGAASLPVALSPLLVPLVNLLTCHYLCVCVDFDWEGVRC